MRMGGMHLCLGDRELNCDDKGAGGDRRRETCRTFWDGLGVQNSVVCLKQASKEHVFVRNIANTAVKMHECCLGYKEKIGAHRKLIVPRWPFLALFLHRLNLLAQTARCPPLLSAVFV